MKDAKPARWAAPLAAAALTVAFVALWWNRFLGVTTDGWFPLYAHQLLAGKLPYRDFYLVVPPLHVFEVAGAMQVFGEKLAVLRLLAMLQRALAAAVLCRWLQPTYGAPVALVSALATVVAGSADPADTLLSYHFDAALLVVIAGWLASRAIDVDEAAPSRRGIAAAAGAGFFAACAALVKQTVGGGCLLLLGVALAALSPREARERNVAAFAGGAAAPFVAFGIWLTAHGLTGELLDAVLGRGAGSKGPLPLVLLRPFTSAFIEPTWRQAAVWALAVAALVVLVRRRAAASAGEREPHPLAFGAALGALLALVAAAAWPEPRFLRWIAVYGTGLATFAIAALLAWRGRRAELSPRDRQRLLLAAAGAAGWYLFGLSWGLWELMLVPGLAFALAEALPQPSPDARGKAVSAVALTAAALLVATTTVDKLRAPYAWGEWVEPPTSDAVVPAREPFLRGLRLSRSTADFVGEVTRLVTRHSRPDEPVLVFPHLAIVYLLAQREPATFAYAHWFDMTPDWVARSDARRLAERPPAVIVVYEISRATWLRQESIYRGGSLAGQRQLRDALQRLTASDHYAQVAELRAPTTGNPVTVWARRDRIPPPPP